MASRKRRESSLSSLSSRSKVVLRVEDLRQLVFELTGRRTKCSKRFEELARDWLAAVARRRVEPENERRHVEHLRPIWALGESALTMGRVEEVLGKLLGALAPPTVNKVRSTGKLIIRWAQGNGEWVGANPFELVRRLREPKRIYETVTLEEIRKVLPCIRADRRSLATTMLLTGLRPGEALGLKKCDVDLEHRFLHIRRSHGRAQTKTGKERVVPIPEEAVSALRDAMAEFPLSEYVFPKPDGSRQRADTKLSRMLRCALKAAGLVVGYRVICRRKGCGFREELPAREPERECPKCGFRLWEEPIPRPLRFYDLRHCAATLHRKAGADPMVVSEMLGHSLGLTEGTYTHLDDDYRRAQLNKLKLGRKKRKV